MDKKTGMSMLMASFHITICLVASLNISSTDESSLLALKSHIDSDILSKNWTLGTSFCTWIGVTCGRRHLRVTGLSLPDMALQGTISREIGNLTFLMFLNMSSNSLSGRIPAEIGKLRRLRMLDMASNFLSDQIPQSLGLLMNLQRLQLSHNFLSGNIPETLSACQTLINFDLSYNNLTGNIPLNLGNLSQLQLLNLMNNQLTGQLPATIFNISSLVTLVVEHNLISGRIPKEICRQPSSLEALWLDKNQFEGEIPASVMQCHSLKKLSLMTNNFSGQISNQLWNLSSIEELSLAENGFTGSIPPSIGNLSNLKVIDISQNSFHGTIPSEVGKLSSLIFLSLEINWFQGELPQSIFNLSELNILAVTENFFSGSLPFSIDQGIPNIEQIYLDFNLFQGEIPNSISNLSQLNMLELGYNSFSGNVPTTLGKLLQLQQLDLASNSFTNNLSNPDQDFLSSLTTCKHLVILVFSINPGITGVLPKSIGSTNLSTSLETFHSSSCKITGQIPDEIGNLSKLIWLDLENNDLSGHIPITLGNLRKLQKLELQLNRLQGSIPHAICNLKNLYSIYLNANNLFGNLPNCLGKLSLLKAIDFGSNALSSYIPSNLWNIKGMESLSLSTNLFEGSLPQEIGNLNSLTMLDLSGNQLSGQIPTTISQLQNVITLSFSNNKFNGLIPDSFAALTNLQHLDMSENNLSGPIPMSLEELWHLSYFNVSFNNLSGQIPNTRPFVNFPPESFMGNKALCGAPHFKVQACKSSRPTLSRKSKVLKYITPAIALVIIVVAFVLILVLRICRRKVPPSLSFVLPIVASHKRISHREILEATNNLDEENLIGRGSISSVYKGNFSDAMVAAVKVFNQDIQAALHSFNVECQVMRSVRHRNLVEVITSCSNLDFKALLMAYMPNGSLEKWLYSADCSLNLLQRVGIMIDVASALEYLHQWHTFPIVHCDLKPSNILLDEDMVAHVGDFGIAKLLTEDQRMQLTRTLGTIGYMAPEYGLEGLVSTMADVYSYGVLLMEMCLRRKPTDEMFGGDLTMKRWVFESFPDLVMEIVDDKLVNMDDEGIRAKDEICLISCIGLALECMSDLAEERPKMQDVAVRIRKINSNLLASINLWRRLFESTQTI